MEKVMIRILGEDYLDWKRITLLAFFAYLALW